MNHIKSYYEKAPRESKCSWAFLDNRTYRIYAKRSDNLKQTLIESTTRQAVTKNKPSYVAVTTLTRRRKTKSWNVSTSFNTLNTLMAKKQPDFDHFWHVVEDGRNQVARIPEWMFPLKISLHVHSGWQLPGSPHPSTPCCSGKLSWKPGNGRSRSDTNICVHRRAWLLCQPLPWLNVQKKKKDLSSKRRA